MLLSAIPGQRAHPKARRALSCRSATPLRGGDHGNNTSEGGYRAALFHLAHAQGQSIIFVGQGANGPDTIDAVPFPKAHDGYQGFTITGGGGTQGITSFTADHLAKYKPHIVTLMIGTNDIGLQVDPAGAPARLGALLDIILASDPNLLLVVAQITPGKQADFNARVRAYNAAIPSLVSARRDAGKHVEMVDMQAAFAANPNFPTDYLNDNVHPTSAGYAKMGEVWYDALGPLFR